MTAPGAERVPRVAALGDSCADVYPRLGVRYPTGNAVDVAVHLRRLGVPVALISAAGDDEAGREMREALEGEGLDLSRFRTLPGATAVTRMDLDGTDRVHGEYDEGVLADLVFSEEDVAFAASFDLVHTAFWGRADSCLEALRRGGARVSFDYATKREDPLVVRTLPSVDYAFFSHAPGRDEDIEAFLRETVARGPRIAVATFGAGGSLAFDGEGFRSFGIFETRAVNTVGAGDAFIAGFLATLLRGGDVTACLEEGARIAAGVVGIFRPW